MMQSAAALALATLAQAQILEEKLTAPDPGPQDYLGFAVASSPGWAFCSAPGEDELAVGSGAVYVFRDTGANWSFAQKLKATHPSVGARFGECVTASDSWLVAGVPLESPFGGAHSGSAEVFHLESGVWVHSQQLIPSDHATSAYHFGVSADLSGDWLVVGAADVDVSAGGIYLFRLTGATWTEVAKLGAPDPEQLARFGFSVALDGDTLAVGAPGEGNGAAFSYQGAVYIYERVGDQWVFKQKLIAGDVHPNDEFGSSVALEGDRLLVGGFHDHASASDGAIYVFERVGGVWGQTAELLALDPTGGPKLGELVDLQGDLAVGAAQWDGDHGLRSGSAYVFRRNANGAWLQIAKVVAPDAQADRLFGSDVCLLGERLLIGARWDAAGSTPSAGSAYVFDFTPLSVQYGSCPTQGPCGNHDDFGGCVNSSGTGGELSAAGSSSVSTDDLHLQARWLPANKIGLFFMGGLPTAVPFADGQLCVTSGGFGVWRFSPAQSTGAAGVMDLGPGVAGLSSSFPPGGQIAPGHIWHFQAWFRDPAGPCGQGSNLTNAVRVNFAP